MMAQLLLITRDILSVSAGRMVLACFSASPVFALDEDLL